MYTPDDVRRRRELEATRHFLMIIMALVIAVAYPFLRPDREATFALISAYVIGLSTFARTAWQLRRTERYSEIDSAIFGLGATIGSLCSLYCFGFFPPAPVIAPMGVFFFSLICTWRVTLFCT